MSAQLFPFGYRLGRRTDFGQWLDTKDGTTVLCLEYWCDRGDTLWEAPDERLVTLATRELEKTGLVNALSVLDSHIVRLPNTHPVFTAGAQSAIETVSTALAEVQGLSTVGRHGGQGVLGMGECMETPAK